MNEKTKKALFFIFLLILTGPFALLWLAATMWKEREKEPEIILETEEKEEKDEFEWKSIWEG